MVATAEEIAEARQDMLVAALRLATLVREACPGPHKPVQHRDAKPPWCRACGYGPDGVRYRDV